VKDDEYVPMDDKEFSLAHPVNDKILDKDIFLHVTSSKNYEAIKTKGLQRNVLAKNWGISHKTICFNKLPENDFDREIVLNSMKNCYCKAACQKDNSSEGVVLQIKGRDLKKLGCNIYLDWNYPLVRRNDSEGRNIDSNSHRETQFF